MLCIHTGVQEERLWIGSSPTFDLCIHKGPRASYHLFELAAIHIRMAVITTHRIHQTYLVWKLQIRDSKEMSQLFNGHANTSTAIRVRFLAFKSLERGCRHRRLLLVKNNRSFIRRHCLERETVLLCHSDVICHATTIFTRETVLQRDCPLFKNIHWPAVSSSSKTKFEFACLLGCDSSNIH